MKVLVIGSGAREHALVRALTLDPTVSAVIAAPGNPGTDTLARNLPVAAEDPQAVVDQGELRDRISGAIAALPEREKLVVALYYYENLTLREIGEVLGVTESRVSQLHTKAVLRLRSKLAGELD